MLPRSHTDGIHIAFDAHQVLITQISGCEALVLQYGADCITSVGAELRQEPRR